MGKSKELATSQDTGFTVDSGNGNYVYASTDGSIEIRKDGGGGYIDFHSTDIDYDARIQNVHNGLEFNVGGGVDGTPLKAMDIDSTGRVGIGTDPEETLHVRTWGNSEISTQYGTGLKAKLGAYSNHTKVQLPSASIPFEVSSETGAIDTLNLTSMYNGTKHYGLRMDDYGRLTTPRQPFFDGTIYNGGAQATGTVLTLSQYTNTGITLGNNNTRLTLPDEGYYFVTASQLAQPNSGMYAYFTVMVNGVTRYHAHNNFYSETNKDFVISKVMHLFANDYIEFAWLHTNIVNSWGGAHSNVSVFKLG